MTPLYPVARVPVPDLSLDISMLGPDSISLYLIVSMQHLIVSSMQPYHGAALGRPQAPPCGIGLLRGTVGLPSRGGTVQRNSLAFAAVTGAVLWKTWTARRQRPVEITERNFLSTGSLMLDLALHGGLHRGRMVEIFGEPQSGKTSLAFSCMQAALRNNQSCAVLDIDRQWPPCDNKDGLLIAKPADAESAMEMMEDLVKSRHFDLIILDSVPSLVSLEELQTDMTCRDARDQVWKILSRFCARGQKILKETRTTIIFTNGLKNVSDYGDIRDAATLGGNAVKYRSSVRIAVEQLEPLSLRWAEEGQDDVKAVRTLLQVVKNKDGPRGALGPPVECDLLLGKGISWEKSVLEAALDLQVMADEAVVAFQGQSWAPSDWPKVLEEDPQVCHQLTKACRKAWLQRMT